MIRLYRTIRWHFLRILQFLEKQLVFAKTSGLGPENRGFGADKPAGLQQLKAVEKQ